MASPVVEWVAPLASDAEASSARGVGDVDGDGYGDVVFLDADSDASLRRGSPSGPLPVAATLSGPGCAGPPQAGPAGDLDGDGLADFWLSWPASACGPARVEVWHGRDSPAGIAPAYAELATGWTDPIAVAVEAAGDTDGDGVSDLLVLRSGKAEWRPRGAEVRWSVGADSGAGVGDTNGDGYADVLLTDGDVARWFPGGPGGLGLSPWHVPGLEGMRPLGLGDVDGDGFDDLGILVAARRGFSGSVTVFGGGPDGPGSGPSGVMVGGPRSRIFEAEPLGDIDGDGFADVATSGPDGSTVWRGGATLTADDGLDATRIARLGDVDGDDLADLAALVGLGVVFYGADADADGDGLGRWTDCDDADPAVGDGAAEIIGDGVDQDCDGGDLCLADADGDGFGGPTTVLSADRDCDDPGEAPLADDCDDADAHRGGPEVPADERDGDCDGRERCWLDLDQDGFGGRLSRSADKDCADWGESARAGDCDDHDSDVFPGTPTCGGAPPAAASSGCSGGGLGRIAMLLGAVSYFCWPLAMLSGQSGRTS